MFSVFRHPTRGCPAGRPTSLACVTLGGLGHGYGRRRSALLLALEALVDLARQPQAPGETWAHRVTLLGLLGTRRPNYLVEPAWLAAALGVLQVGGVVLPQLR